MVKTVTEEMLVENGYRKYVGEGIDIYYSKDICAHIGKLCFEEIPMYLKSEDVRGSSQTMGQ